MDLIIHGPNLRMLRELLHAHRTGQRHAQFRSGPGLHCWPIGWDTELIREHAIGKKFERGKRFFNKPWIIRNSAFMNCLNFIHALIFEFHRVFQAPNKQTQYGKGHNDSKNNFGDLPPERKLNMSHG